MDTNDNLLIALVCILLMSTLLLSRAFLIARTRLESEHKAVNLLQFMLDKERDAHEDTVKRAQALQDQLSEANEASASPDSVTREILRSLQEQKENVRCLEVALKESSGAYYELRDSAKAVRARNVELEEINGEWSRLAALTNARIRELEDELAEKNDA